ncbi:TerC family protein [Polycladomyces subterraneus]|uniref:TerC family protein n=1 Tax=Polycladomyces subterraneus TaxID=1016997 RepID=A0ABT8IQ16_9BACL|nr:TerC family protein [Polycladomyces subterraneus]MDN4594878.1 TerC family protein [Polycladomyces subterraneus]
MDTQFLIGFINIIILDLVLSGDNAVVIGMAARALPERQRKKAIIFGTSAAIVLRVALTGIAAYLLNIPLLMSIGGLILLWIAVKLVSEEDDETEVHVGRGLKEAIKTIIVADVVMSLDNVLAVAGASHGDFWLVLFGLMLSIPIIMWGSRIIAVMMNKLPWLVYVGSAILGYTAGQLIVEDPIIHEQFIESVSALSWAVPLALALLVVIAGGALKRAAK